MKANTYLIINRYLRSRTSGRRPYITLASERGGEQMTTCENWQLFVHDGRHNHKIVVHNHGHAQAARRTEEQLKQTAQFRVCAIYAQKIYNVVAKIKKNRMQGRNTVEKVLCLSAEQDYTVFYRNCKDGNVLCDIVIAHPTPIAMIKTWSYVLIMDITYKMNKVLGSTYRWVLEQIKHLYVSSAMSTGNEAIVNDGEPIVVIIDRESGLMPVIEDMFSKSYHMLRRRNIDQNMLAKLTEVVKDEEVATQFINGSWQKLINEIDEAEYHRKLEQLKTKWQTRPDFLHYLLNTWLNPLAINFVEFGHLRFCILGLRQRTVLRANIRSSSYGFQHGMESQAGLGPVLDQIPVLGLVLVHVEEVDRHRCLGVGVEGVAVDEYRAHYLITFVFEFDWYCGDTVHRLPLGTTTFHIAADTRWRPTASFARSMARSS
ncbi:hypothetical protein M9H77_16403 [Catharanthus roseus]|uniref:Uncharacterized protein n=1 Tax=Catharanthus roseus TaxID=4058 RepID=A0ACC0B1N7_CATRO|nr:hypothetical protein M9H77_16403 [Catharanthus roseus]